MGSRGFRVIGVGVQGLGGLGLRVSLKRPFGWDFQGFLEGTFTGSKVPLRLCLKVHLCCVVGGVLGYVDVRLPLWVPEFFCVHA